MAPERVKAPPGSAGSGKEGTPRPCHPGSGPPTSQRVKASVAGRVAGRGQVTLTATTSVARSAAGAGRLAFQSGSTRRRTGLQERGRSSPEGAAARLLDGRVWKG